MLMTVSVNTDALSIFLVLSSFMPQFPSWWEAGFSRYLLLALAVVAAYFTIVLSIR